MNLENSIRIRKVKDEVVESVCEGNVYLVEVQIDVASWWRRYLYLPEVWAWRPLREIYVGEMAMLLPIKMYSPYGDGDVRFFETYDEAQECVDQIVSRAKDFLLQERLKGE